MSEPSAEVIEAVAKALAFTQHDQDWGDGMTAEEVWVATREKNRDIQRERARAALNAAGAAVERDSADVAKEVPDLGNSITGVWLTENAGHIRALLDAAEFVVRMDSSQPGADELNTAARVLRARVMELSDD